MNDKDVPLLPALYGCAFVASVIIAGLMELGEHAEGVSNMGKDEL